MEKLLDDGKDLSCLPGFMRYLRNPEGTQMSLFKLPLSFSLHTPILHHAEQSIMGILKMQDPKFSQVNEHEDMASVYPTG